MFVFIKKNVFFAKATPTKKQDLNERDLKNPDPSKRNMLISEVLILKDFIYEGSGEWSDGTVYDPNNGKVYCCVITMKEIDKIEVKGYVGISWFGRSESWTRVK